jgi:hypothetical protein
LAASDIPGCRSRLSTCIPAARATSGAGASSERDPGAQGVLASLRRFPTQVLIEFYDVRHWTNARGSRATPIGR